jgi:uncharacterized protein (UPF0335 family)
MQITNLRKLFDYQKQCIEMDELSGNGIDVKVHRRIAEVTKQAHQLMEQCLDEILDLEGWDRSKLEMPTTTTRKRIENN